ncbi:MAG: 16S rRNA (guanine(527)-N(7))-methyltransferase RsmG [Syntrophaceae bacterium]|nr:16S rRNA (guanine(527)-N(7))-methyltransferase RsmG [Syntrophaceae bacterium]
MERALIQMLADEASKIGIVLGPAELSKFALFYDEFQLWNAKMNLTAVAPGPSFVVKHFIDCLQALPLIPKTAKTLLDLGTGGGFPGIPLAIAGRNLQVILLDASRKKTSFLRQVVIKLGLSGIRVVTGRAETLADQVSDIQNFDVIISRATFKLAQFLSLAGAYAGRDGIVIAMKGREWRKEMAEAESILVQNRFRLVSVRETVLPGEGEGRVFLIYKRD